MEVIAAEKTNYYYILMDEMKRKYKRSSDIEKMIEHKGDDEWNPYMSLKRQHIKRQNELNTRVGRLVKKDMKATNDKLKTQKMIKRAMTVQMGNILGLDKDVNFHFDVYTAELKQLISKLNDDHIDASSSRKAFANAENAVGDPDQLVVFDPHKNVVDEHLTKEAQEEIINILAPMNKDEERKQKLKMQLFEQSTAYYSNNLNIFSNGMSLLSVSGHEMHNKAIIAKT